MLEVDGRGETCGPRLATLPAVQVGCSVDVGAQARRNVRRVETTHPQSGRNKPPLFPNPPSVPKVQN
eukprot:3671199-Amphidinium_carterae.1